MSETFNRRFALEQAVLLHTRKDGTINNQTRTAVTSTSDTFFKWLEKVK